MVPLTVIDEIISGARVPSLTEIDNMAHSFGLTDSTHDAENDEFGNFRRLGEKYIEDMAKRRKPSTPKPPPAAHAAPSEKTGPESLGEVLKRLRESRYWDGRQILTADQIKGLRKKPRRLSQENLANCIETHQTTIAKWENDTARTGRILGQNWGNCVRH
jgi:DNA-binding transcriptional regulator YiaG